MSAFMYGIGLQWKADMRSRNVLVTFYAVPLLYFAVFGGIFAEVMPEGRQTLLAMMTVFSVSMGALIGVPPTLLEMYRKDVRATYQVNGVPVWHGIVQADVAAFLHLLTLSAIVCILSPLAFDAALPANWGAYIAGTMLLTAATLAVADVIGIGVRDASMSSAASIAVFLPSILLSGIMFPEDMLPGWLRGVGNIFPATWSFRLMCGDEVAPADVEPLLLILAIAAAAVAVLLWTRPRGRVPDARR